MTEPETPDAGSTWRRMHPLSPLLRGGLALVVVLGVLVANFRDRIIDVFFASRGIDAEEYGASTSPENVIDFIVERGLVALVLAGIAVVIGLVIGVSWLMWRFATFRVTAEAVEARNGIVFRQHRRAPLKRIQAVNLQRPLLARALGLTKIEVVTAGQGGKVELAYLSHRDAKTVRETILAKASHAQAAERTTGDGDGLPEPLAVGFDGQAYAPAADALSERAQDFADADIHAGAAAEHTLVRVPVGRLIASLFLGWESLVAGALLIAAIVTAATGGIFIVPIALAGLLPLGIVFVSILFTQFNRGFNFSLSRGDGTVRTSSGLTSTFTETVPFGRIHAVEARQPILWRPLGWWRVRVTTAGHSVAQAGQNGMQNIVLPVGREDDVIRVLATLLPGIDAENADHASELRSGLVGDGHGYTGAGPRAAAVLLFARSRTGVRIADPAEPTATLRIRRGVLTRSLAVMPIVRAQSVQLRRPLVHRFLGLASLRAHTVLGPVEVEVRGLALERARGLFDELAATVLRVQNGSGDAQDAGETA